MKIKSFFRLAFLLLYLLISGFSATPGTSPYPVAKAYRAATVYVCDSPYAKKYHYSSGCRGLNACKHTIVKMSRADAEGQGLTLCSWD